MISATSFGSTQCTRERTSGDPKRVLRDGGTLRGDVLRAMRVKPSPQVRENLDGHPRANTPGIDELAVIGVVTQQ